MSNKPPKIPEKFKPWIEARTRYRLSHIEIQMARELGMNPKRFGSLANANQERWKLPLNEFIRACCAKQFGRNAPDDQRTLEQRIQDEQAKKLVRREHRASVKRADL